MPNRPVPYTCAVHSSSRLQSLPYYLSVVIALYSGLLAPAQAAEPAPVYVIEAKAGPVVEELPLTGTITSARSAALSSRVSGLVARMNVDAGDRVATGDVLIELDPVLAKLALNRSQAALNEAQASLQEAKRLSAEARDLAKNKNIPQTTLQSRIADVEIKTAVLARLEAEYRQQAEVVERHILLAPFTGVVSSKLTEMGEWVETGSPVLNLVATDQLRLDVQAPQEYFHQIDTSTAVAVKLDAAPGQTFSGQVTATVPVNNLNARTFLVRVSIDNANDFIIPGMSAQAVFHIPQNEEALLLPRDATIQHPDGRNTVWVINKVNGQLIASEQQVQLGRSLANNVVVRKGLNPGSLVVIRGNETLKEGQTVRILEQTTADTN